MPGMSPFQGLQQALIQPDNPSMGGATAQPVGYKDAYNEAVKNTKNAVDRIKSFQPSGNYRQDASDIEDLRQELRHWQSQMDHYEGLSVNESSFPNALEGVRKEAAASEKRIVPNKYDLNPKSPPSVERGRKLLQGIQPGVDE